MIKLYKKEDGKKVEIKDLNEVSKPFFICLDEDDNIVNTEIKSKDNKNSINIIGIDYEYDEDKIASKKQAIIDFLLSIDGKINLISSSTGTKCYKEIESILEQKLSDTDLEDKITLVSILSSEDTSDLKAHTISFIDVNDKNIETEFTTDYKNALQEANRNKLSGHYGRENNVICVHNGKGSNDFKDYLEDITFKTIISYVLEKTINNEKVDSEEVIYLLDNSSEDLVKYNFKYIKPKNEVEVALDAATDMARRYLDADKENKRLKEQLDKLISCIKEYSSDTTYNQILMASGILGFEDPNFLAKDNDKKIRAYYDEIMSEVDEEMKNNTK